MTLPVPTLDHVVVNTQDQLDAGAEAYRALGFTLTPRGYHTLGSANHLAMFGTDYLELIGILTPDSARTEIMTSPRGLNGLVFGSEDTAALHAALTQAGVAATAPMEFSRPVELPGGAQDAVFRTVHLEPQDPWPGRIYYCQHFTRNVVWRDEWRRHANGAVGVSRMVIASDDPARLGGLFGRMFGAEAVHEIAGGIRLVNGMSRVDVLSHAAVAAQLGEVEERAEYMAGLTLRTTSLAMAAAATGHAAADGRVLVPAAAAFGCVLEFAG